MILRTTFLFFLVFSTITYGQDPEYENQLSLLLAKGYAHYGVQKDSGQYYFKKIERLALAKKDSVTLLDILITSNRHLGYFYDLSAIRNNLNKIDKIVGEESPIWRTLDDSLLYRNSIRADKGNFYFKIGSNEKAKSYFNDIKSSYRNYRADSLSSDHFLLLSNSMSFLAKTYLTEDKYDLAKDLYERTISLIKTITPEDLGNLYINFALLAEVLTEQGKYDQSNSYLSKVLENALKQNNNPNRIISVAHHLAENYMALSKLDSAHNYLGLMANQVNRSPNFKELYHRTKSKFELKTKNLKGALNEIGLALDSYLEQPGELNHETLANLYLEKGNLLALSQQNAKALEVFNEGLDHVPSKFGTTYLELVASKAKSLIYLEDFVEVNKSAHKAVKALDSLRPDYQYSSDKINLIEKTFPLFESALEANYLRFEKTGDPDYLDEAFFFMEKSKSVLLLEALMESKANQFAQVPDSLLEKERLLRSEITLLEKELKRNTSQEEKLRNNIFILREQQARLLKSVSDTYPQYYGLRYGGNVITLRDFSKVLDQDELMISYFYGNQAIYAMAIGRLSKRLIKIPLDEALENKIKEVYAQLSNPKSDIGVLSNSTYELYNKLMSPLLTSKETSKLTLVTDGLLNYLPFSALNTDSNSLNYLVETHAISYANSATLLGRLNERRPVGKSKILAFAPSFDGTAEVSSDRSELMPLPHNKKEVEQILKSFGGRSLVDEEASLESFRSQAKDFNILHLATHAIFDDTMPEYSYLAFAQEEMSDDESVLFVADLYNLKTEAELVTLSACETNIGELRRGEGFLGLARGFFYSGASSIASTLWKVNDASSAQLMELFYKNLAEGNPKHRALQKAKAEFLELNEQNALVHPYYWSGFIVSGNTAPLKTTKYWLWILLGSVAVCVTGVRLHKKFGKAA